MWKRAASRGTPRMLAALLAVVVLLLPPLVRATAPALRAPESPSAFRLNRAFDMPESKWRMVPAAAESLDGATPDVAIAAPAITCKLPDAELLPDHQTVKSPDPFRGPPSVEVS